VPEETKQELLELVKAAQTLIKDTERRGQKEAPLEKQTKPFSKDLLPVAEKLTLEEVRVQLGDCTRCKLHLHRTHLVFGVGNPKAELIFVGEGPGRDEDLQGEPFVGAAGKLLDDIIESIGLSRDEVYICNVVKCRPPNNRNPEPDEIETCQPFLFAQIACVAPKLICTLGKFAAQTLLKVETPISVLRGRFSQFKGIPVMPTYHPAYLLRNPSAKKEVWQDMKQVHAELCRLTGKNIPRKGR